MGVEYGCDAICKSTGEPCVNKGSVRYGRYRRCQKHNKPGFDSSRAVKGALIGGLAGGLLRGSKGAVIGGLAGGSIGGFT